MPYASEISADSKMLIESFEPLSYAAPYAPDGVEMNRTFHITVVAPVDDDITEAPMVVWTHGGADGAGLEEHKKTNWARFFANAGYIVVMISHTRLESEAEIDAIRTHLGVPPISEDFGPTAWKFFNYLRLLDIKHVVANIDAINAHLESVDGCEVIIDKTHKYALAGHSAGSGATITYAGATRYWRGCDNPGSTYSLADNELPEPSAFLCYSMQPPLAMDHLCPNSWDSIRLDAPVLTASGDGDSTTEIDTIEEVLQRKSAHQAMVTAGSTDKYLFWITDDEPNHSFYNLAGSSNREFSEFAENMRDISIAFLDKYILDSADAHEYLRDGGLDDDLAPDVDWAFS